MYRVTDLVNGLFGLIGWRQHYMPSQDQISTALTQTTSGAYFQDVHPLLTLDNVRAIAPNFTGVTYPAWSVGTTYQTGDVVTDGGNTYRAKATSVGISPATLGAYWERSDAFSIWLEQKTKASILKVAQAVTDTMQVDNKSKRLLESKPIFKGVGSLADTVQNTGSGVGLAIELLHGLGVVNRIDRVGLQFTGTGAIRLYLMHSSRATPVRSIELTRTVPGGMQWFDLGWTLPWIGPDTDAGGVWYLVYDQGALPVDAMAVNRAKDWSRAPCSTCDAEEQANYNLWSKYTRVTPFRVPYFDGAAMWDIADEVRTYQNNYGINLQLTIECDITDVLLAQKNSLQTLIGLQVAADMVREFAYNPAFRVGRAQLNFSRLELLYELDGDSQGYKKSGLVHSFNKALEAVTIDFSGLRTPCFSCGKPGIRYRTI